MNLKFLKAALELSLFCSKYWHVMLVQSCWVPLPRYLVSAGKRAAVCLLFRTFLIEMTVSQRTRAKQKKTNITRSAFSVYSLWLVLKEIRFLVPVCFIIYFITRVSPSPRLLNSRNCRLSASLDEADMRMASSRRLNGSRRRKDRQTNKTRKACCLLVSSFFDGFFFGFRRRGEF